MKIHREGEVAVREIQKSHSAKDNVIPEILELNGLKIYYTEGGGEYHYYCSKNDLVVWISLNNPERAYRSMLIDEAIKNIGR